MGGGGSTAGTVDPLLSTPFKMMMNGDNTEWGVAGATLDWNSRTYDEAPNLLRWMLEYGLTTATGVSPYYGVSAYDPEDDLEVISRDSEALRQFSQSLDPSVLLSSYSAQAFSSAGTNISQVDVHALVDLILSKAEASTSVAVRQALEAAAASDLGDIASTALAAFRARQRSEHAIATERFAQGLSDANAVQGSSFVLGLAMLESKYEDRLAQYDAEYTLPMAKGAFEAFVQVYTSTAQQYLGQYVAVSEGTENRKVRYTAAEIGAMMQALSTQGTAIAQNSAVSLDVGKTNIISYREEQESNLDYDSLDVFWDAEVFQRGANMMSAMNGSVVPASGRPSRFASALGGAAGGASLAAASTGNPYIIAGATIAGGLAGFLDS